MKRYQVDQDNDLNTLTKLTNCMYYVDLMGNLLSNQKLAFYEWPLEKNFITRMMQEGHEKEQRNLLAKSYIIIQEIYNDIMTPLRQKLMYNSDKMKEEDRQSALALSKTIAYGTLLEDIHQPLNNLKILRDSD